MNIRHIKKLVVLGVSLLALCALMQPPEVDAGKTIQLPFKFTTEGPFDNTGPLVGISHEQGISSHGGKTNYEGLWHIIIDQQILLEGEGTMTVANGDQINWVAKSTVNPPISEEYDYSTKGVIKFEGGTGRFEFAEGECELTANGIYTLTGNYNWCLGKGWITY